MLKSEHYCITRENIAMHELIGLNVRVVSGTDSSRIGISGKVVNETKNTLVLESSGGEKIIPKKECVLEFELGDEKAVIRGSLIARAPEDRAKQKGVII